MEFNAYKSKEIIFFTIRRQLVHPPVELGSQAIVRKNEHKHFGVSLDSELNLRMLNLRNFQSQVSEAVIKARRGIGLIRYLSKYVSRDD